MSQTAFDLPPHLTIRSVSDVQPLLRSQIDESDEMTINASNLSEIDLSGIQLLEAARIYAGANGKSLRLASPADGTLLDVLNRAGWLSDISLDQKQFWLHEGEPQ